MPVANVSWPAPGECFRMIYRGFIDYPMQCSGGRFRKSLMFLGFEVDVSPGGTCAQRQVGVECDGTSMEE
jgi:hypothetical protein